MLSFNGARQISGNNVMMSIRIQKKTSNAQRRTSNTESDAEPLLDNFEDGPLAVARRRAREQRADRLNGLATSANHTSDIAPSKLQFEDSCSAAWNLGQHHIVRKFNQLADDELEKLSHASGK